MIQDSLQNRFVWLQNRPGSPIIDPMETKLKRQPTNIAPKLLSDINTLSVELWPKRTTGRWYREGTGQGQVLHVVCNALDNLDALSAFQFRVHVCNVLVLGEPANYDDCSRFHPYTSFSLKIKDLILCASAETTLSRWHRCRTSCVTDYSENSKLDSPLKNQR